MGVKFDSGEDDSVIADINVTPFVDVVLVLLVIFIVTAPTLLKESIGLKLPQSQSSDRPQTQTLAVAVNVQGQILLDGIPLEESAFLEAASQKVKANPEIQGLLSADKDSKHGDVVRAIDLLKRAGVEKFAVEIVKPSP